MPLDGEDAARVYQHIHSEILDIAETTPRVSDWLLDAADNLRGEHDMPHDLALLTAYTIHVTRIGRNFYRN